MQANRLHSIPLFAEDVAYIRARNVRDAYRYLIGAAICSRDYECRFPKRGRARVVDFCLGTKVPFSLIVNRKSLLFYFRNPAQADASFSWGSLSRKFPELKENPSGEFTNRVSSLEHARQLADYVFNART